MKSAAAVRLRLLGREPQSLDKRFTQAPIGEHSRARQAKKRSTAVAKGTRLSSTMTTRLLRATLVALAASLLSTCSDATNTAGRRRVASLSVSPVLVAGQSSA